MYMYMYMYMYMQLYDDIGAFFRTSVFEMGGACFKEPGPVFFASGGGGTDFTLYSTATFRPDLCTIPQPTVSTALAGATMTCGVRFLSPHAPCAGQVSYRRRVRAVERFFFFCTPSLV